MVSAKNMKMLEKTASALLIVGGLFLGLLGLTGNNYLNSMLSNWPTLLMVLYLLIGASAVSKTVMMFQDMN